MTPLFKKLNFKGQKEIGIFNAPSEFQEELESIKNETSVATSQSNYTDGGFVISFVKSKKRD